MELQQDPLNLIITGVGGQGNVLASQIIGKAFIARDFRVTIGETYGASQRGGSVMSHLRISKTETCGPLIPQGKAHVVVGLEPIETLRVLGTYGNPTVWCLMNTRPVMPLSVLAGEARYPEIETVMETVASLCAGLWTINATEIALKLGSPILSNMALLGALISLDLLPLTMEDMQTVLEQSLPGTKLSDNLDAFQRGRRQVEAYALKGGSETEMDS